MGYHEQQDDRASLRYAGRVGTGFDEAELERLAAELDPRARADSPFAKQGIQPPRGARFVEPELVAEIEFSHWTRDRHPAALRLQGPACRQAGRAGGAGGEHHGGERSGALR